MRHIQVAICRYSAHKDPKAQALKISVKFRELQFSIFKEIILLGQTVVWGNKDAVVAQAELTVWSSCFLDFHPFH